MLHRTREKHDLNVILLVVAVEVTEEAFDVVEGAIFFAIGSQMCRPIFRDWRPGLLCLTDHGDPLDFECQEFF